MNDDIYLKLIKQEFSGCSTKQLLDRETLRFKQELKKNYMVHGFPGLGFSSIVERHNKYCTIINSPEMQVTENLSKIEKELHFEALKAWVRKSILDKTLIPKIGYECLRRMKDYSNQFSINEIEDLNIPLNRLQFCVSKLSTDLPCSIFDEYLREVKLHIKTIEELGDK